MSRRRDRLVDLAAVAGVLLLAFTLGRGTAGSATASEAHAKPPTRGFPVDAGAQRKEIIEELRRIRELLETR